MIRGIRGAIVVKENSKKEILEKTKKLLKAIISSNKLKKTDIASIFFSTTEDLDAEFPAAAARGMGLNNTALLCAREIPVPGSLGKVVRVLLLVNSDLPQNKIKHIYLDGAEVLRK